MSGNLCIMCQQGISVFVSIVKDIWIRCAFRQELTHRLYVDIFLDQLVNYCGCYVFIGEQFECIQIISSSSVELTFDGSRMPIFHLRLRTCRIGETRKRNC